MDVALLAPIATGVSAGDLRPCGRPGMAGSAVFPHEQRVWRHRWGFCEHPIAVRAFRFQTGELGLHQQVFGHAKHMTLPAARRFAHPGCFRVRIRGSKSDPSHFAAAGRRVAGCAGPAEGRVRNDGRCSGECPAGGTNCGGCRRQRRRRTGRRVRTTTECCGNDQGRENAGSQTHPLRPFPVGLHTSCNPARN